MKGGNLTLSYLLLELQNDEHQRVGNETAYTKLYFVSQFRGQNNGLVLSTAKEEADL